MGGEMNRRSFMKAAGAAAAAVSSGLAGILESGRAPAHAQGTKLHLVRWVDFVPAGDEMLRKQMPEASKALGAEVTLETINANDLQARITAAISSGTGADIFHLLHNWAHLYEKSLVDVGDIVDAIGKAQGGFYPAAEAAVKVGATWRAVPHVVVGGRNAYRKSIFEGIGLKEFPKTWQEYREAGKKLKAKGYPIGQTAGHTFGDAPSFWYPFLWSFGGKEVEKDGKTVAINSKESIEAVKFAVGLWKDAMDEGGLAWDDTNNNRAFLSGTICATNNGASIYIESLRNKDKYKTDTGALMHTDILHAPNPAGPAGVFEYHASYHHGIMSYSKNQKLAKDFLRWLHAKEQFEPWFVAEKGYAQGLAKVWDGHPMWREDPVMQPFKDAAKNLRFFGYAGPPSAKASEAYSKYIIVDLFARAIQGMPADEAVKWAEGELKKVYA